MRLADYLAPTSVDEAVELLGAHAPARPLAGGHSLLLEPNRNELADTTLVDLRRVRGLSEVEVGSGGVRLGAMATLGTIAASGAVADGYTAITDAARVTGDAQVRNRATVGGTLADADPGADLPAALLAMGARAEVQGSSGTRTIDVAELIVGEHSTSLESDEVITAVAIPAPSRRTGSAYEKFAHPATLYAVCGVAAVVALAGDGTIAGCACAITGALDHPTLLEAVAAAARGGSVSAETFASAAQHAAESSGFRGDAFGSAEFRRHLAVVLSERALARAAERASADGQG
jgi:aerobic carbon-monoxide dehydrogenase medium subunit